MTFLGVFTKSPFVTNFSNVAAVGTTTRTTAVPPTATTTTRPTATTTTGSVLLFLVSRKPEPRRRHGPRFLPLRRQFYQKRCRQTKKTATALTGSAASKNTAGRYCQQGTGTVRGASRRHRQHAVTGNTPATVTENSAHGFLPKNRNRGWHGLFGGVIATAGAIIRRRRRWCPWRLRCPLRCGRRGRCR